MEEIDSLKEDTMNMSSIITTLKSLISGELASPGDTEVRAREK